MKKILCLLVVLCMVLPVAALGEEVTLNSIYPTIKSMMNASYSETKAIIEELLRYNYTECDNHYWYYFESSVDEEVIYEIYLELNYEDNRFIHIVSVHSSRTDRPLIMVEYNGEAPDENIVADYLALGMHMKEIQDKDELNCCTQFATDIE